MKNKVPTGKAYDSEVVNRMTKIILKTRGGIDETLPKLYELFQAIYGENRFYKKTPKVFSRPAVFFVQAHNAYRKSQLVNNIPSRVILCMFYSWMVVQSPAISCMPDVDMSEAGRILKATNQYKAENKEVSHV